LSKYTKEEDIEEDSSSLITRTKKAKDAKKVLKLSLRLQEEIISEAAEGIKDTVVEEPKEVVARKQAEDMEHIKELSQNLQGMDDAESSNLVTSQMKVKKESDASDAKQKAGKKGNN